MTEGQRILRKNLLAKIHQHPFCKNAKTLNTWGEFLMEGYGVESSAKLSIDELHHLYNILKAKALPKVERREQPLITEKQCYAIKKRWEEKSRKKTLHSLLHFIHHITGTLFLSLNNITKKEASVIIAALERL